MKILITHQLMLIICLCITSFTAISQNTYFSQPVNESYKESALKFNMIIDTKLDILVDFKKQVLAGKEWLTIRPYSRRVNTVELDAKRLIIKKVELHQGQVNMPLRYFADDQMLNITLDKSYGPKEQYLIYIEYETKPAIGESAVHFINPDGKQKGTPIQVWTSGQPEKNSSWFPTIDKPNQKTKQVLSITVPNEFQTLSNGKLVKKIMVSKDMRKDTWQMAQPHAPYLSMFAVGKFSIVKELWKGKEVSYYVEPQFAQNENAVKAVFPNTLEAIDYFSKLLAVDYPWSKYSQIKLRGFSGAIENTTASAFNEDRQSSLKELSDQNYESGNIHELFHQWFGNYVTAESWANICLNESFADLSEIIWAEHKYGSDVAGDHVLKGMQGYLNNQDGWSKNLVRYHYENPQEVFDGISYQKGGRILNMLRYYLGNETFYKGLTLYLKKNALQSAEVQDLRLALEDASGQDLNWFFNQWFFGAGHPELDIRYGFETGQKITYVVIEQTQKTNVFRLPVNIDIYLKNGKETIKVWLNKRSDTIRLDYKEVPLLVNVDASKILIAKKTDHKTLMQFAFQYFNAPLFQDRYEAVEAAKNDPNDPYSKKILLSALKDNYYGIRTHAINNIDLNANFYRESALSDVIRIAKSDPNNSTRVAAIKKMGSLKNPEFLTLFNDLMKSESYAVQGEALIAIGTFDPEKQFQLAKIYQENSKGKLREAVLQSYIILGSDSQWEYVYDCYTNGNSPVQYAFTRQFAGFIQRITNPKYVKDGVIAIKEVVTVQKNSTIAPRIADFLNEIKLKGNLKDQGTMVVLNQAISEVNEIINQQKH
ncbi:M1 family aminopeptidase [Dyadobacter sp. 3J3]|uniref:M1 family aminopeptidase n=1 Tax=Dyadobacter sp. 3J3 TaxID=2606600 RepID=UPI001357E49E|nr:M1 family aminopeptidase [Dyadobacter sp. 3J3]